MSKNKKNLFVGRYAYLTDEGLVLRVANCYSSSTEFVTWLANYDVGEVIRG